MNNQWRSKEGRSTYADSLSGHTPLLTRPSLQDAIRPGTVASRIESLQKLASPSSPRSHPPPISITRGEDSRTGFGRRVNNRFGKPALVNANPDEEPHMEAAFHSYLGLNTPRVTHQQRHAISSHRTKYAWSPGINGQIIPDGIKTRMQHDAVAPWGVLSRSNHTGSMSRHVTDPGTDVQTESSFSRPEVLYPGKSSGFRSHDEEARYFNLYRWNTELRLGDTLNSVASNTTTSTIRRQSVRDLFKDFGIERPAGLVSRGRSLEVEESSRQLREQRLCHACLRINTRFSITCSRCSHKLCFHCDKISPFPAWREKDASDNKKQDHWGKDPASKENRIRGHGPVKESNPRPAEARKRSSQETLKPLTKLRMKLLDEQHVDLFASQKRLSQALEEEEFCRDKPSAMPFRICSQAPSSVKDSPFLIADLLASSRSLAPHPVEGPAKISTKNGHDYQSAQNHQLNNLEKQQAVSSSSDGNKCSNSTCRATHHGHQPYRHAVSCEKRHHHVHKYTDEGYSADTSHVRAKTISHTTEHHGRHGHNAKAKMGLIRISGSFGLDSQSISEQEGSEFVEYHGYPRTGHSHLGSPVSSGIIGECQHCLHGCHCDSCKSTYHSVRCCEHDDHKAKVHHHLTPKKGGSVKSEISSTAVKLNASNNSALHKSVAVVSPTSGQKLGTKQKVISKQKATKVMTQATKDAASQEQRSEKPQLATRPSFPKANHPSFVVDNVNKPPTPPPWVSSPRKQIISGIDRIKRWQETKRENNKSASIVKPPGDPSPSNERLNSPPPSTCNENVPEDSRCNIHNQVTASHYDGEYQHSNEPCQNYRRLSKSSIVRKTSVPLMNQKLLEHQEELRRNLRQKECEDKLEGVVKKLERFDLGNERRELDHNVRSEEKAMADCKERARQRNGTQKTSNWRPDGKDKAELFTNARPEEENPASTSQSSQKESELKNGIEKSLEQLSGDKTRKTSNSKMKPHEKERVEKAQDVGRREQGKAMTTREEKLAGEESSDTICNKNHVERVTPETFIKKRPELNGRVKSVESGDTDTVRNKTWKIRLVDRRPSPACVNDEPVEQYRQADCEVASSGKNSLASLLGKRTEKIETQPSKTEEHTCFWKSRLLDLEQIERLGIQGVTVLLHLDWREDVVFIATDWKGGKLRREN